ncbi:helix-turn-helix transcriptional regulator [Halobacterium zhouii]|uniref:helix-turn-helix transcriptional regulator n=1 Tax=Halobacterium zhouii TaxID=2902624 RepID=UPI001E526A98|nr:winged helix-turn-helix domain-containing protein [Halobacterium zhouii]
MSGVSEEQRVVEEIEFLARSPNRVRLLEAIREAGTIEKQTLQNQFDMVRTTLVRNLETLEERGWVQASSQGTYTLTCAGEVVAESFSEVMDTVRITKRLQPFLKWLPSDEFDLDLRLLADAEITCSTTNDPYAPVQEHVKKIKQTERARIFLSVMGQQPLEEVRTRILNGDAIFESVVEPGIEETINANARYRDLFEEQIASGGHNVFVYEGTIPYYLGILDDTVQIGAEDDEGVPRALLETDSADVREWAEQTYANYQQEARPLAVLGEQSDEGDSGRD